MTMVVFVASRGLLGPQGLSHHRKRKAAAERLGVGRRVPGRMLCGSWVLSRAPPTWPLGACSACCRRELALCPFTVHTHLTYCSISLTAPVGAVR